MSLSLILLSIVLILVPLQNKSAASANKIGALYLHIKHKLFLYIRKSKGPRLDPCGTPQLISFFVISFSRVCNDDIHNQI